MFEMLKRRNVELQEGLSVEEINKIEKLYSIKFPPDVKKIYMEFLPVSSGFYNWRDFSAGNIEFINSMIEKPFESIREDIEDVEWGDAWGDEPSAIEDRNCIIEKKLEVAPKLIPLYSHRYIPSGECEKMPVFSIHDIDIIYYGENISKYFEIEFGEKTYDEINFDLIIQVPFWSEIL